MPRHGAIVPRLPSDDWKWGWEFEVSPEGKTYILSAYNDRLGITESEEFLISKTDDKDDIQRTFESNTRRIQDRAYKIPDRSAEEALLVEWENAFTEYNKSE